MTGETKLSTLLRSMEPVRQSGEYVFCTIAPESKLPQDIDLIGWFREDEGTTVILSRPEADAHDLDYSSVFCMITLSVHSSLEAVGFLAAITQKLAQHDISVNPISAYYHDHLFVLASKADDTMALLKDFAN